MGGCRAKEAKMRKIQVAAATLLLGLSLTTPALAGHHGSFRGHGAGWRGHAVYYPARPRAFVSFGFGFPFYGYARPYGPAPVYYAPYPVYSPAPYCHSVWVPGHYVLDGGVRFFVGGHWSYEGAY